MMKTGTNALLGEAFPPFHGRHAVTQDEKKEQDKSKVYCYIVHVLVKQQNKAEKTRLKSMWIWLHAAPAAMGKAMPVQSVILEISEDRHWRDFEMKRQCSWSTLLNVPGKAADHPKMLNLAMRRKAFSARMQQLWTCTTMLLPEAVQDCNAGICTMTEEARFVSCKILCPCYLWLTCIRKSHILITRRFS